MKGDFPLSTYIIGGIFKILGGGGGGEGPVWDIKTPPMQSDLGSYCLIPLKERLPLDCIF